MKRGAPSSELLHMRPDRRAVRERDEESSGDEDDESGLRSPRQLPPAPLEPPPFVAPSKKQKSDAAAVAAAAVPAKRMKKRGKKLQQQRPKQRSPSLEAVLETLAWHFLPDTDHPEFRSFEHMLVPMEEAWWYYIDVYRVVYEELPEMSFRAFVHALFEHCPRLQKLRDVVEHFSDGGVDGVVSAFARFKASRPVAGVVLLDSALQRVLLVRGAWKRAPWTFPRGKIKEGEDSADAAVREALEETGVDVRSLIDVEHPLVKQQNGRQITLFVAMGVPDDGRKHAPLTRNEVSEVAWHTISSIREQSKFATLRPFLSQLDEWIAREMSRRGMHPAASPSPSRIPPSWLGAVYPTESQPPAALPQPPPPPSQVPQPIRVIRLPIVAPMQQPQPFYAPPFAAPMPFPPPQIQFLPAVLPAPMLPGYVQPQTTPQVIIVARPPQQQQQPPFFPPAQFWQA